MNGASSYRKGAAFENKCLHELAAAGYVVMRSAGSKTPMDLIALKRTRLPHRTATIQEIYLVQCKMGGRIRPAEVDALLEACDQSGGVAILATVQGWWTIGTSRNRLPWTF